jgi:hypothetical protein
MDYFHWAGTIKKEVFPESNLDGDSGNKITHRGDICRPGYYFEGYETLNLIFRLERGGLCYDIPIHFN